MKYVDVSIEQFKDYSEFKKYCKVNKVLNSPVFVVWNMLKMVGKVRLFLGENNEN